MGIVTSDKKVKKGQNCPKMAIFPNALALYPVGQVLGDAGISVGAQNTYWLEKGGFTGEISAAMFKSAGCEYVLVGHSERRHLLGETNHEVRQKVEASLAVGLTPVICVGETEKERQENKTEEAIEIQVRAAFHNIVWKYTAFSKRSQRHRRSYGS